VAAGLPSLPALAGRAKTYAERLFEYPQIDQLSRDHTDHALADPARVRKVIWEQAALDHVYAQTDGYPYFVQEYGKYIWDVASDRRITAQDARKGGAIAQDRLDNGFFKVRYESKATRAEREFLHAMASCDGPPYAIGQITAALGKDDQRLISPRRNTLIRKGLVYAPEYGLLDYTVPQFAEYLRRQNPD
jgi:hypothetical protein